MTFVRNHPFPFGDVVGAIEIVGAVLSIFTVRLSLDEPPVLWPAHAEIVLAVSDVKLCVPHPESTMGADSKSSTNQSTITLLVYQPFVPAVPMIEFVITGGVTSGSVMPARPMPFDAELQYR